MSVRLGILLSTLFIIATLPPLATAGGGGSPDLGGIVRELNFIETPTYILSILFAFFLFVSLAFERIVHILLHYFKKKKRFGLVASVNALVLELTLVGFVSLILTAIEQPISTLCVSYDAGDFHDWTLISALSGCNCCLKDTTGVSTCFKRNRNCGYEYCNCGYPAENTCPVRFFVLLPRISIIKLTNNKSTILKANSPFPSTTVRRANDCRRHRRALCQRILLLQT